MQAVILAAGRSTRTYPLTLTRPKPLLKVANKTLLEWNLQNLSEFASEVLLVVGYQKGLIKKHIGTKFGKLRVKYVEQKEQLGTAHALLMAEPLIKDRFMLLMGDDIYSKEDIRNCVKHKYSILAARVKNPQNFGVIIEKNKVILDFVEKPKEFISDLASTAFYCLDRKIFGSIKRIKKSERNELEMPDAIKVLAKQERMMCVRSKKWFPIVYPWDLLKVDKELRGNKNLIGKNSKIYGRALNSSIGNGCVIKGKIKNSIIMDNSVIGENSIVEDSVIGQNVRFSGKATSRNNTYSKVKDKEINAGRMGTIIGDNSWLADVYIKAGCKINPNKKIKNKKIEHDIE